VNNNQTAAKILVYRKIDKKKKEKSGFSLVFVAQTQDYVYFCKQKRNFKHRKDNEELRLG
jgi:hypothetical protein